MLPIGHNVSNFISSKEKILSLFRAKSSYFSYKVQYKFNIFLNLAIKSILEMKN
jgi:hypothetical protein